MRSLFLAIVVIPRYPRYTHSSLSRCIVEVYMFGLRAPELIIILVVVLIIFGPKNLPKLGKSLGSTVKNIREGMEGDDKAETKQAEEVVVEQSEEDKEIAELEAKLAAAKKKQKPSVRSCPTLLRRVVPSLWGEHLTGLPAG